MHMIPSTQDIDRALQGLRRHDMISLSGYLCDIRGNGGRWRSSRIRTDTGPGACEIVWVEHLQTISAEPARGSTRAASM